MTPTTIGNTMFTIMIIIAIVAVVGVALLAAGAYIDMRSVTDADFRAKRDNMIDFLKNS